MSASTLVQIAFWCAAVPAALFCWNLVLFRRPPRTRTSLPAVSILIPARDEEENIAGALDGALSTEGIEFEVVVLDDGSTDRTAAIVAAYADRDSRVRLEHGPSLPAGWAGKAHAAHVLSAKARFDLLCFVDADVRLAPDAVARIATLLEIRGAGLVSGFPEQETVTTLEWLLLPLIHFLLLAFLPLAGLRHTRLSGFGAGCGQFLLVRRDAYQAAGGYAAIRSTMHDGLRLPSLLRKAGFRTDLADLTDIARCRMYRSSQATWNGLLKNATEGLAAPARIVPFTALLLAGQVLPWLLLFSFLLQPAAWTSENVALTGFACVFSLLPRVVAIPRFHQRVRGVVFHPISIVLLLILQWWALLRRIFGIKVQWKERAFRVG